MALDADRTTLGFGDRVADESTMRFLERYRFVGMPIEWEDIVGHDHAKRELRVVAAALSRRDLAERLGVPLVSGILLTGPSGSGKTLLARAFASSVDRPVFVLPAAELTPRRIRRIYTALADVPSVLILDEVDAIGRKAFRNHARPRTAVALCVALDGVVPSTGPITIGLTAEAPEYLDPSIIRSGRLTTKIVLEGPDREERLRLLQRYAADLPVVGELDLETAADRSQGMTGADISATILAAAGLALADGLAAVDQTHLDEALERRGVARRMPKDDEDDRRSVAVHEAGHAIVAFVTFGSRALNDVAIARTRRGFGHTSLRREWLESNVATARWRERVQLSLAGLLAEELVSEQPPGFGSREDVDKATQLVLMAIENGLVPEFGRTSTSRFEKGPDDDSYDERGSESMRSLLWDVTRSEIRAAEVACRQVLVQRLPALRVVSERLLRSGALSGADLAAALEGAGLTGAPND